MKPNYLKYINEYFNLFIKTYGFVKQNEINDGDSYSVEFCCKTFIIKIEKYHREFYLYLCKSGYPEDEINIINLLNYMSKANSKVQKSTYFTDEKDVDECYRKQLKYLSDLVAENLLRIESFFRDEDYKSNFIDLNKYMIQEYPGLFKRS